MVIQPPPKPRPQPQCPPAVPPAGGIRGGARRAGRTLAAIPTPLVFGGSVLIALLLLWRRGDLGDVGAAARRADGATVVLAMVLYLAGLALLSARWHLLVRMTKGVSDLARASEAFLTSVVINYAAPVGLAVPTRAALTKRALGLSAAETGAIALWEVLLDVIVLGAITLLWAITGRTAGGVLGEALGAVPAVLVGVAAVGVVAVGVVLALAMRRPGLRRRVALAGSGLLRFPRQRPVAAAWALAASVIYWLGQGMVLWLLLEALNVDRGVGLVLGLTGLPVLVGMLSPVPGGAGVREALMVAVAHGHGADGAAVLVAAVTYRIALFAAIPILYLGVRAWLMYRRAHSGGEVPVPVIDESPRTDRHAGTV